MSNYTRESTRKTNRVHRAEYKHFEITLLPSGTPVENPSSNFYPAPSCLCLNLHHDNYFRLLGNFVFI